ncbi:amino acid ABC transporter permease [Stenoxybacter acetivorans]|uniref:amino acid ABC transporter permease n=1 Tax=Stenoxybacter acetivorans TaxID=422441 RepID=UPI001B802F1C|nr:amino acid ABC transporter permease [Stenoxybacter acetivorans]
MNYVLKRYYGGNEYLEMCCMDWDYVLRTLPAYGQALSLTLKIAVVGIAVAIAIGVLCNVLWYSKISVFRRAAGVYVALFRNTPLMIQLFFMFYALPQLGIKMTPILTAMVGLSLLGGSFMAEAIRGGLNGVAKNQIESAKAIGLTQGQIMRYVMLPQAVSYSVPSIGANCIFLIKETSIFSVIAVVDLMNVTKTEIGMFYKTNEALLLLVLAYAVVLIVLSWGLTVLEKRVRYAEFGH